MNVSELGSFANSSTIEAYNNYKKDTIPNLLSTQPIRNSNQENDSLEISKEALEVIEKEDILKELSEKAYKQLKIRKISEEDIKHFKDLIDKGENVEDAKEFLKSLTVEERNLVKRANSYGHNLSDSHINQMTQEGARNMIKEPDGRAFVDFNNDGIVDHGIGKSFVFPPPNSPEKVKDAWEKTIEGLPEKDQLLASSMFLSLSVSSNIKYDSQGKAVGIYTPFEEGYKNIYPNNMDGWVELMDKLESYLDFQKANAQDTKDIKNNEKDFELFLEFKHNLESRN